MAEQPLTSHLNKVRQVCRVSPLFFLSNDKRITWYKFKQFMDKASGKTESRPPPLPLPLRGGECLRDSFRRATGFLPPLMAQPLPSLVGEGLGVGSVI